MTLGHRRRKIPDVSSPVIKQHDVAYHGGKRAGMRRHLSLTRDVGNNFVNDFKNEQEWSPARIRGRMPHALFDVLGRCQMKLLPHDTYISSESRLANADGWNEVSRSTTTAPRPTNTL